MAHNGGAFYRARDAWERAHIAAALERYGSVAQMARVLRINRTAAFRILKRYGLKSPKPSKRGRW